MGRRSRYRATATVKRVTNVSDGYGGLKDSEATIVSSYSFMYWHLSPWDREAYVGKHGLERDAILRLGVGDYDSTIRNGDVLDISATERWEILSTDEVWGKSNTGPVSMGLLLAQAGNRPA